VLVSPGSYCRSSFLDRKVVRLEHKVTTFRQLFGNLGSVTAQVEGWMRKDSVGAFWGRPVSQTRLPVALFGPFAARNSRRVLCRRVDPLRQRLHPSTAS
jgi:hypothetical protein